MESTSGRDGAPPELTTELPLCDTQNQNQGGVIDEDRQPVRRGDAPGKAGREIDHAGRPHEPFGADKREPADR